ncbi:MAG: transposase [Treponema sp.]|jgi:ribosomal protein S27AE|nr:transposase [Treponema sp.]
MYILIPSSFSTICSTVLPLITRFPYATPTNTWHTFYGKKKTHCLWDKISCKGFNHLVPFEQQLKYKCEMQTITVVNINPRYTSRQCNRCGTIDKRSRNKSRYICVQCGHTDHADIHAAKNIRDTYARSK